MIKKEDQKITFIEERIENSRLTNKEKYIIQLLNDILEQIDRTVKDGPLVFSIANEIFNQVDEDKLGFITFEQILNGFGHSNMRTDTNLINQQFQDLPQNENVDKISFVKYVQIAFVMLRDNVVKKGEQMFFYSENFEEHVASLSESEQKIKMSQRDLDAVNSLSELSGMNSRGASKNNIFQTISMTILDFDAESLKGNSIIEY